MLLGVTMKRYLDRDCVGQFVVGGLPYSGVLTFSSVGVSLVIYVDGFSPSSLFDHSRISNISGTLFDLTRVTLLRNIFASRSFHTKSADDGTTSRRREHLTFVIGYVLFTDLSLDGDQHIFNALDFHLPDFNSLFCFDSFDHLIHTTKDLAKELIANDHDYFGKDPLNRSLNNHVFGSRPEIFIYTGAHVLCEFKLHFGTLKIKNNPHWTLPSNSGFVFNNTVSCHFEFIESLSLWEAVEQTESLKRLLELILGRKQTLTAFQLEVKKENGSTSVFEAYRHMVKQVVPTNNAVNESDRLIYIEIEKDEFVNVINDWLSRQEEWKYPRNDFFSLLGKLEYTSDTLIKLANMFDLIPNSAYQNEPVVLSDDILKAKNDCRAIFKALPPSSERDSILGALGRLGSKSLKNKIMDRYKVLERANFVDLDRIDIVISQAVDCRNFFVHGTSYRFDYLKDFSHVCFFIDTLSFIYAASEMVQSGWTSSNWQPIEFNTHPFSMYIMDYEWELDSLDRTLLSAR